MMKSPSSPRPATCDESANNNNNNKPIGVSRNVSRQWTFVTQDLISTPSVPSTPYNNNRVTSSSLSSRSTTRKQGNALSAAISSSGLRCATAQASTTSARLLARRKQKQQQQQSPPKTATTTTRSNAEKQHNDFASWFDQTTNKTGMINSSFETMVSSPIDNDEINSPRLRPVSSSSTSTLHRPSTTPIININMKHKSTSSLSSVPSSHVVLQPLKPTKEADPQQKRDDDAAAAASMSFLDISSSSTTMNRHHCNPGDDDGEPVSPSKAAFHRSNRRAEREKRIAQMQARFDERQNHFVHGVCGGIVVNSKLMGGAWLTPKPIREGAKPEPIEIDLESVSMAGEMLIPKKTSEALKKETELKETWKETTNSSATCSSDDGEHHDERVAANYERMPIPNLRTKVPFEPSSSMAASVVQKYVEKSVRSAQNDDECNAEGKNKIGSPLGSSRTAATAFSSSRQTSPLDPKKVRLVRFEDEPKNDSASEKQQTQSTSPSPSVSHQKKFKPPSSSSSSSTTATTNSSGGGSGWKRLRALASVGMTNKLKSSMSPTRPTKDRTAIGLGKGMTEYDRKMEAAEQRIHGESVAEIARRKLHAHVQKFVSLLDEIKDECGFESGTVECAKLEQVGEALRIRHISLLYESLHSDGKEHSSPLTELDASTADPELLRTLKHEKTLKEAEANWRTVLGGAYSGTAHISSTTTPWSAVPGVNRSFVGSKQKQKQESREREEEKEEEQKSIEERRDTSDDETDNDDEDEDEQEQPPAKQEEMKRTSSSQRLQNMRPRKLIAIEPQQLLETSIQTGQDIEEPEVMCRLAEMHFKALGNPPASIFRKCARVLI